MAETDVTLVLISRREATERRLVHYFTGVPCKHGHIAPRQISNGDCIVCARRIRSASKKKPPQNPIRLAAKLRGDKFYVDGTPCRNGHEAPRRAVINATCMLCSAERCLVRRRGKRESDPTAYYAEQTARGIKHRPKAAPYQAVYQRNRRSKKRGLPGSFTVADVETLRVAQKGRCFWCDKETARLEVDHIHPVAKDGHSYPSNLVLACRTCNASKGDRDWVEWATEKGFL